LWLNATNLMLKIIPKYVYTWKKIINVNVHGCFVKKGKNSVTWTYSCRCMWINFTYNI
jgi:hypothetical protein